MTYAKRSDLNPIYKDRLYWSVLTKKRPDDDLLTKLKLVT
jgi:hypothetical protein